jgi:hypothetical protein
VQWYFGDGSSSTGWNADHIYTHGGTYTVCLKVIRDSFCIRDTCKVIVVNDSIPPVQQCNYQVNFMRQFDSVNLQKVFFTNTTIVPVSASIAKWTFGDGAVAYGWNADHIYTAPGRYYVCLTVSVGNNCIKSKCDTITVGVTTFSCDSSRVRFEYRRDNYMPNKLFFFAISNTAIYQEQWSFSRVPSTSPVVQINQFNPVYVFGDTGLYRVCLRAMLSNGCVREYCDYIRIYSNAISTACYLQAFPNPAHNYVTVNAHLPQPELITASIYNLQNILVSQTTQQGFTGNNALILNIASLPTGFYTIRVVYGDRVCYSRFQKI